MARKNNRSKTGGWEVVFGDHTVVVREGSARVFETRLFETAVPDRSTSWCYYTTQATSIKAVDKAGCNEFIIKYTYGKSKVYAVKGIVKGLTITWRDLSNE